MVAKHVLRYLKSAASHRVPSRVEINRVVLALADLNRRLAKLTEKEFSGTVLTCDGGVVTWIFKQTTVVAQSLKRSVFIELALYVHYVNDRLRITKFEEGIGKMLNAAFLKSCLALL